MEADSKNGNDDDRKSQPIPTDGDLMNYAKAYIGAYMEVVEKEQPDSLPPLAKNAPYDVEVALLPNRCFALLFQKSNKDSMIVSERDWSYVEGKVVSGIDHLVTVYAHEGWAKEDAVARGKKDAMTDIRGMESNEIVQASLHLEKIVDELTNVAMSNRASLKSIASQLSKLSPIKDQAKRGFPQSDMVRMVQGLKEYPTAPVEIILDVPDRELLERISSQLTDTSELIRRVEAQEDLIEELEERINREYSDLATKMEEKMSHNMAMMLAASDRKIDKGLASIQESAKTGGIPEERIKSLASQIEELKQVVATMASKGQDPQLIEKLQKGLSSEIAQTGERMREVQMRVAVIEDYLMKISGVVKKRV